MADDIVERLRKAPLYTSWGEACDLPEAAADLIERQAAEIARLRAGGCSRDQGLTQYCAEAAALAADVAKLRQIVSECAAAIGNGAFCSPEATIEFMGHVPTEIKLVAERQSSRIAELEAEVAALKNPWRPVDDEARNGETWLLKGKRGRQSAGRYIGRLDAFSIVAGEHWLACDVTHYAPLPPSPNRED